MITLSDLKYGEIALILGISDECKGEPRRRLLDLGFVRGTKIIVRNVSPLGNPVAYSLRETLIALRKDQSDLIMIEKLEDNDTSM